MRPHKADSASSWTWCDLHKISHDHCKSIDIYRLGLVSVHVKRFTHQQQCSPVAETPCTRLQFSEFNTRTAVLRGRGEKNSMIRIRRTQGRATGLDANWEMEEGIYGWRVKEEEEVMIRQKGGRERERADMRDEDISHCIPQSWAHRTIGEKETVCDLTFPITGLQRLRQSNLPRLIAV